jgi:hypothetical protein
MTACETRELLDYIDAIRSRVYRWLIALMLAGALIDVAIREPRVLYEATKWPLAVVGGLAFVDLLIRLARRRYR